MFWKILTCHIQAVRCLNTTVRHSCVVLVCNEKYLGGKMWFSVKDFKLKKGPNGSVPAPDTISQLHQSKQTSPAGRRLTEERVLLHHSCTSRRRWDLMVHRLCGAQVKHSFSINYINLYNEELNHLVSPVSVCVAVHLYSVCHLINWRTSLSEAVGQLFFLTWLFRAA